MIAALALYLSASPISAATSSLIGQHLGFGSLSTLASGSVASIAGPNGERPIATYRLPQGSRQGPEKWYTLRIRLRVKLVKTRGECDLSAATNSATAAQIIVRTGRSRATVTSLSWIDGARKKTVLGRHVEYDFRNYLQVNGVRGGKNTLTAKLETLSGHCIEEMSVLPDSGIGASTARPDELVLLVPRTPIVAVVGQETRIPFKLKRRGGRADRRTRVQLSLPPSLELVGDATHVFSRIGRARAETYVVKPRKVGTYMASVGVPALYNQPSAEIQVEVVPAPSFFSDPLISILIVAALFTGAFFLLLWNHRD